MNWILNKILKFTGTQKFLSIQLDITNACNLDCPHCYQSGHSAKEDLSLPDWRGILDQYEALAGKLRLSPNFCLSGGEPTISPLFSPLLSEIHSRWPDAGVMVLTNGTNLSGGVIEELVRHKAEVQVSIDGPDAARHEEARGPGSFVRSMEGFSALRRAGLAATFQAILSDRTAPWIREFFKTAKTAGALAMNFTRFVSQGRGKDACGSGGAKPLAGAALKDAYSEIVAVSRECGVPTATDMPLFALLSPDLGAHGKFGFQGLVVDHRGCLKVSSRADFRLGSILETGLEELFLRHPLMKDLRDGKIEGCGDCGYYDRCGGDRNAAFAEYGSFLKKDPGCWL